MYVKKPRRVVRKRVARARKQRKTSSVSLAVKKYVKRTIHSNVENKRQSNNQFFGVGSFANNTTLYARPLTPYVGYLTINQGLGQGDRTGNRCKVMKAMLRYTLFPLPYDLTSNPLPVPSEVQIIIGYVKSAPSVIPSAAIVQQLFQTGNTTAGPQGDLGDLITPFNTDVWTIKKVIRHKIGNSVVEGTGSQTNKAYLANNDFKFNAVRSLDITSIYPKNLIFQDTQATIQNPGLFIMIQAVAADGTSRPAANNSVFFDYNMDLTFEDA